MDKDEALRRIADKKTFLDAVVLSGGEPTLEDTDDLIALAKSIKDMGLKVKLDTNGTNSHKLEAMLPYVDYVAMDIKAPLSKYRQITCVDDAELFSIKHSIELLKNTEVDNEFRTTVIPTLSMEDIMEIAQTLKGCKHYYLQQYVPVEGSDIPPLTPKTLRSIAEEVNKVMPCEIRGL
jgi:pyruvate formate lyase activating enzyme